MKEVTNSVLSRQILYVHLSVYEYIYICMDVCYWTHTLTPLLSSSILFHSICMSFFSVLCLFDSQKLVNIENVNEFPENTYHNVSAYFKSPFTPLKACCEWKKNPEKNIERNRKRKDFGIKRISYCRLIWANKCIVSWWLEKRMMREVNGNATQE